MHNDLNERRKAKKRLALNSCDIHVGWIVGAGVSMLIFLLATFATAYRHDAYFSRLGLRDLMTTDVWFRVFLALTCFSLLLFLGLLVYAFVAGRINRSGDNEGEESLPPAEERASTTEQPERVIINEAKLRDIFNSEFMHEWIRDGKTYLDQEIEDLQFVRDHYLMGAKKVEDIYRAVLFA
jgi:Ca2+/Na+ antiporter